MKHAIISAIIATAIAAPIAGAAGAAVTGAGIVNGTVTGVDIRDGSIGTRDVGALTSADIVNGSLTSADLKNGSVSLADLAPAAQATLQAKDPQPGAHATITPALAIVNGRNVGAVTRTSAGVYCVAVTTGTVPVVSVDHARSAPAGPTGAPPAPTRRDDMQAHASMGTPTCGGVEVRTLRNVGGNYQLDDTVAFSLIVGGV